MKFTTSLALLAGLLAMISPLAAPPEDFTVRSATDPSVFQLKDSRGSFVAIHFLLKTECPICLKHTRSHAAGAASLPNLKQVFLKPDTDSEIAAWAGKLDGGEKPKIPIYRDPDAKLAKAYGIPDGYAFHGQTVHYPATVIIGPDGKEIFRYVGKNNGDRLSFEKLAEVIKSHSQSSSPK